MNSTTKLVLAAVAFVVLAGGIIWAVTSSGDEDEQTNTTTSESQPADDMTQQEEAGTIVEVAQDTPQLSTLVDAVVAAELAETLSGEGPFTVFAPTNDAFAALPEGTLDSLLQPENQDQLTDVLTYHVVAGEAMSGDLSDGQTLTTVQGQELTVSIRDGNVYINDAMVATPDVQASNGVVHVIDSVLLPN